MMIIVGDALFGAGHGRTFMLFEAATVVLALIGTTLSCMNTGARVTYAMGKDKEVTTKFGLLHSKKLTPHRAIWTLAAISAAIGCVAVLMVFGDAGAPSDAAIAAIPHGIFSSFGYTSNAKMAGMPNSLLTVTLASNFGTFLLYALSCTLCIVAYHKHPKFSFIRHMFIPLFGLCANLACMIFYLVGPFMGYGTKMEPLLALGIAAVWGIYGGIHFLTSGKAEGKTVLYETRPTSS
jgi:amino acid transporter